MNILQKIAKRTRERIEAQKTVCPLETVKEAAGKMTLAGFPFERALLRDGISFICEVKKASPSKGVICESFDPVQIAKNYEAAGASAISVLTEPFYFLGSDSYLSSIADCVQIPLLRKDFIVDPYMIYEAKAFGASAVLLICSLLDTHILKEYCELAAGIGLSALVEVHDEREAGSAIEAGARIIGVNNRDLKTFGVDIGLSERLRPFIPPDIVFVSESGVRDRRDVLRLIDCRADAVLIGEALMRSADMKRELAALRGETEW